jgi:hypothetical protein
MAAGGNVSPAGNSRPKAAGTTSRQLQWPFVGVVVLLILLIILTPDLFSSAASGLQTRAQLIVERVAPGGNTSFYVESIGTSTVYQAIDVALAPLPSWPYAGSGTGLRNWTWTNATNTLVLVATNAMNPVVVNVTVKYTGTSGVSTEYVGVYGFYLNATTLTLDAVNLLPGGTAPPASTPLADLPIYLTLSIRTTTGITS